MGGALPRPSSHDNTATGGWNGRAMWGGGGEGWQGGEEGLFTGDNIKQLIFLFLLVFLSAGIRRGFDEKFAHNGAKQSL